MESGNSAGPFHSRGYPAGGVASALGRVAETAQREPEIVSEMQRQKGAIADLHDTISGLQARLESVLVSAPPTAEGINKVLKPVQTALGSQIGDNTQGVREAAHRLRDIVQRLEV